MPGNTFERSQSFPVGTSIVLNFPVAGLGIRIPGINDAIFEKKLPDGPGDKEPFIGIKIIVFAVSSPASPSVRTASY